MSEPVRTAVGTRQAWHCFLTAAMCVHTFHDAKMKVLWVFSNTGTRPQYGSWPNQKLNLSAKSVHGQQNPRIDFGGLLAARRIATVG